MATSDELKVYRDEGEEEQQVSENLKELKNSLVTELAEREEANRRHTKGSTQDGKEGRPPDPAALNGHRFEQYLRLGGYVMGPYPGMPYPSLPMINHVPFSPSMFMYPMVENFQPPPPAHSGIHVHRPHPHIKTGLASPFYPSLPPPPRQFAPFGPDFRAQNTWNSGIHANTREYMPISQLPPPPSLFASLPPGRHSAENNPPLVSPSEEEKSPGNQSSEGKAHVKKPLNAFMLYMKDKRAEVMEEFRLKESAQINQVLGKRWHLLPREEQAKYYERANREKDEHHLKYPEWSARENYAANAKKKKRKREKSVDADGNNAKKCRARFGLTKQDKWCKPCRRKKKCIRYRSSDSASASECPESSPEDSPPRLSDGDSGNVEDEGPSSVSSNSVLSIPTPSAPATMDESPAGPLT